MDLLKQYGVELPSWQVLVAIAIGVVVLLVAAALIVRWARRRPKQEKAPSIARGRLAEIYRDFLRRQLRDYRRSILGFQPIVVLGDISSAKTELINRFSDWKQQATDFLESSTSEPELQLYLGSRVLIHEIAPSILADSSRSVRSALLRLWKPTFSKRKPIVVVALNAQQLRRDDADELTQLAHLLRGKINLISAVTNASVETRVVLTNLHELPGFAEFCEVAVDASIETRISDCDQDGGVSLAALEAHLPQALLGTTAPNYLALLGFLAQLPQVSQGLNRVLGPLFSTRALGKPPQLESVYFVGADYGTADPLWIRDEDLIVANYDPARAHRIKAAAIAMLGVGYLGSAYVVEQGLWVEANDAVTSYTDLEDPREWVYRSEIKAFLDRNSGPLRWFPSFFTKGAVRDLKDKFSHKAVDKVVGPKFRDFVEQGEGPLTHRAIYMEGLLRGTLDNDLGELVIAQRGEWSVASDLPEDFIYDYIRLTNKSTQFRLDDGLRAAFKAERSQPWNDRAPWETLFGEVEAILARCGALGVGPTSAGETASGTAMPKGASGCRLTRTHLDRIVAAASELDATLDRLHPYKLSATIVEELKKISKELDNSDARRPELEELLAWLSETDGVEIVEWARLQPDLRAFLHVLKDTSAGEASQPATSLEQLARQFESARTKSTGVDKKLEVKHMFGSSKYHLDPQQWERYVSRARVHWLVDAFLTNSINETDLLFAGTTATELGSKVQASGNSQYFVGKPALDPRYTARAFTEFVRPAVAGVYDELDSLGPRISAEDKQRVVDKLGRLLKAYADQYDRELAQYFRSFKAESHSQQDLPIVLSLMASDASYFATYLHIATDNACMDLSDPRLAPLDDVMVKYSGLCTLADVQAPVASPVAAAPASASKAAPTASAAAPPKTTTSPKLVEYRTLITQLSAAVSAEATCTGAAAADPEANLCGRVSGAGSVALGGLSDGLGSYNVLIAKWANSVPLAPALHRPFLAPLPDVYRIGGYEVADAVSASWQEELEPALLDLYGYYPFNRSSEDDATPEMIEQVLHPKTGLLAEFVAADLVELTLPRKSGTLVLRDTPYGPVPLDPEILAMTNAALELSAQLYTKKGKPKSLRLAVRARPLSKSYGTDPVAIKAYVVIGDTQVLAFNQRTVKQRIVLDWTKQDSAMVGVQLVDPNDPTHPVVGTPSQSVPPSYFSALRLLDLASSKGTLVSWVVGAGYSVTFRITQDPRKLFRGFP